jgi:hypothetical protein
MGGTRGMGVVLWKERVCGERLCCRESVLLNESEYQRNLYPKANENFIENQEKFAAKIT